MMKFTGFQTLEIFIVAEEKELNNRGLKIRSSLRVSARVDLSITKNPETQELDYFVSGISRGPGMLLYGSSSARNIQRYGLEYANSFIKWVREVDPRGTNEVSLFKSTH